jgi:hypothetical protein
MVRLALALACSMTCLAQDGPLPRILARISEEAGVFRAMAPKVLARETLTQRAQKPARRGFPIRIGEAALKPPPPEFQTREIVSEYGFAALRSSPGALNEFRQVITVDGRQVATEAKARESLVIGLRSADDKRRKRMVEQFEKHGLTGAASDFGQLILLFTGRRIGAYDFRLAGEERLGADPVWVVGFREKAAEGSLLVIERQKAIYQPVEGEIWVRRQDLLPVRVSLRSTRSTPSGPLRDEATVDYVHSPHGLLVPASVVHRQFSGPNLIVENLFRYSPFLMFAAEAEIKFP